MILQEGLDITEVFSQSEIDLKDLVSENEIQAYETEDGIKYLNTVAFKSATENLANDYKPLETVYFIHNNNITEGVIRKVNFEASFNASYVGLKETVQIATEDGDILSYPGDIENFYYTKEELINFSS